MINLSQGVLDGECCVVILIFDCDSLVVFDRRLILQPPGLVRDGLANDVDWPGVRSSNFDGRDSKIVANDPRFNYI